MDMMDVFWVIDEAEGNVLPQTLWLLLKRAGVIVDRLYMGIFDAETQEEYETRLFAKMLAKLGSFDRAGKLSYDAGWGGTVFLIPAGDNWERALRSYLRGKGRRVRYREYWKRLVALPPGEENTSWELIWNVVGMS